MRKHAHPFVRRETETHCNSKTRRAGLGRGHVLTDEESSRVDESQAFASDSQNLEIPVVSACTGQVREYPRIQFNGVLFLF